MAVSKRWDEPEKQYRDWFKSQDNFELGQIQFVQFGTYLWVANLIGQHKINKDKNGNAPIRYGAISKGLLEVAGFAKDKNSTLHMPRIGCGLAGGIWDKIEPLIQHSVSGKGVQTFVYDFG